MDKHSKPSDDLSPARSTTPSGESPTETAIAPSEKTCVDPLPSLILNYDAASNELSVNTPASAESRCVNSDQLKQSIHCKGYENWLLDDTALNELATQLSLGEAFQGVIGRREDACVQIDISVDKQSACATLIPAQGGETLSQEILSSSIKAHELHEDCIDPLAFDTLVASQAGEKITIARAIPPGKSSPCRFEPLIQEEASVTPSENTDGSVDHKNIHNFIVVDQGQPLLRRIPAIIGKSGTDVLGAEIPAEVFNDLPFPKNMEGVEVDAEDEHLLKATISGHPVFTTDGVMVDPVLQLPCVNMQSGNINFSGSVMVKGDVESGFTVKATSDIVVKGTVLKATIIAGGSVQVSEGIIGADTDANGEPITESSQGENYTTQVTAAKDIHAKFITLSNIQCGGDIDANEYLLNSLVQAKGFIRLGQTGGKGFIIGGHTHADKGITAKVLGSEAYVSTPVSAGRCPQAQTQLNQNNSEHEKLLQKKADVTDSIGSLSETNDASERENLKTELVDIDRKLSEMQHKQKNIMTAISSMKNARVTITQTLYPNVKISINGSEIVSKNQRGHTVLAKFNNGIKLLKA